MTVNDLESHYLAGGRLENVTHAMIAANRAVLALDWNKACAIDLAGRDTTDAINTSVNPKVIDVPDPEWRRRSIDAVAMDGSSSRPGFASRSAPTSEEFRKAEATYLQANQKVLNRDRGRLSVVLVELADLPAEWTVPPLEADSRIDRFLDREGAHLDSNRTEMHD